MLMVTMAAPEKHLYCLHELNKEPISGTSTSNYLEEFPSIELDDLTDNSVFKEFPGNGSDVKIGISSRDFQSSHFPSTAPCISIRIDPMVVSGSC